MVEVVGPGAISSPVWTLFQKDTHEPSIPYAEVVCHRQNATLR